MEVMGEGERRYERLEACATRIGGGLGATVQYGRFPRSPALTPLRPYRMKEEEQEPVVHKRVG